MKKKVTLREPIPYEAWLSTGLVVKDDSDFNALLGEKILRIKDNKLWFHDHQGDWEVCKSGYWLVISRYPDGSLEDAALYSQKYFDETFVEVTQ